jgi:menaquinone-dependent protoporphyrinogen oxidase
MPNKKLSRRDFLKISGLTLGASAVACSGLTALAVQSPPINLTEISYGDRTMPQNVLIAYASKCGSTGEIAQSIGQTISQTGAYVDVLPIEQIADVSAYQTVFVGSAIRRGHWLPEAVDFLNQHQLELQNIPTACFTACMTLCEDTPESRQKAKSFFDPVREIFQPHAEGYFAGKVDPNRLSFMDNTMLKIVGTPEGDYRNWNAINQWATETYAALA